MSLAPEMRLLSEQAGGRWVLGGFEIVLRILNMGHDARKVSGWRAVDLIVALAYHAPCGRS